jgi:hypothetical protein
MFEGTVKLISKDSYEDEKQGMVFDVYVQPTTPFLMIEGLKQPSGDRHDRDCRDKGREAADY